MLPDSTLTVAEEQMSPIISARTEINKNSWILYCTLKRVFDFALSVFALALLSPLMLLVAALINFEGEGPVIHQRICVGENGRQFIMYKFRSMVSDADNLERYLTNEQIEQYKKEVKLDNDPRITKIGKFIRKTSIDELPQLFSIIKGDMSLVGPRPLVERELNYYGSQAVSILSIKPGLTGYWQVNGRSESTYESGKRQELELFYVKNCSLLLDIKIILQTIKVVLGGAGAK